MRVTMGCFALAFGRATAQPWAILAWPEAKAPEGTCLTREERVDYQQTLMACQCPYTLLEIIEELAGYSRDPNAVDWSVNGLGELRYNGGEATLRISGDIWCATFSNVGEVYVYRAEGTVTANPHGNDLPYKRAMIVHLLGLGAGDVMDKWAMDVLTGA